MRDDVKALLTRRWPLFYALLVLLFTAYLLLDAFVIPRSYAVVTVEAPAAPAATAQGSPEAEAEATATVTETSYDDGAVTVTLTTHRAYETEIYVADIVVSDPAALKTAFAENTYGKNITETTSSMAEAVGAVVAVNGDYYSARSGYVIRGGVLYRATSAGAGQEDLVIYDDGTMEIIREGDVSADQLLADGAVQVLSFGPGLVEDGAVSVSEADEVAKAKTSNPRTALGQITTNHYVMVVADGRTDESAGLSLYELAAFMQALGVKTAYNLDGGGSSTMVLNGAVVNNPTAGNGIKERSVSDIVYIG